MDKDLTRDALTTISILANENEMPGVEEARAMGRAIYLNLGTNIEEHFFEGMVDAASNRGSVDDLISAFEKASGYMAPPPAAKAPRNEDPQRKASTPGEHTVPGTKTVWRSATRKSYGGASLRRGDRVLVWPKGRVEKGQADEPVVGFCAGIDGDGDPVFRLLEVMPHQDDLEFGPNYVDTLDELRPGKWTRLPW